LDIGDLDFNLLKTLHVLLAEHHVTRAAEVLGRSQPAVSNALHRLRSVLGDELLVRGPNGLTLTPRAEAIQGPLREVMALVEGSVFGGSTFDPAMATDVFRISTPDRLTLAVVPSLFARLQRLAPRVSLHVITADRNHALDLLNEDRTDLAIGWLDEMPRHLNAEFLLEESPFCVMRRSHPLLKSRARFDMDGVLSFPHLVVSATGGRTQIFDDLLARHGLRRNALVTLTNFTAVPYLLERSDMIGVFTQLASEVFAKSFGLAKLPVPLDVGKIVTNMVWHARNDRDKKHAWLRKQIKTVYERFG
jgi:DNA-binding transcriptional LysR family regulator